MSPWNPRAEGTIPFVVDNETYETWFRVFGDLTQKDQRPLVILHGGPGLAHDVMLPISDLSSSRPVIFYDQLGNSRSTHLPDKPTEFWTIDLFIDELVNLLNHFGIQDGFDLLGHSWGGMLGLEFEVRRRPIGLKHLVVSNSLATMASWNESAGQLLKDFPKWVQEGMAGGMGDLKAYGLALVEFHRVHGCTVDPVPAEFAYTLGRVFEEGGDNTVGMAMFTGEIKNWSIIDKLHLVRPPTFVINGRADISQDFVNEPFFRHIPRVKWVTFEKSSHTPMWEEREKYMHLVDLFLTTS